MSLESLVALTFAGLLLAPAVTARAAAEPPPGAGPETSDSPPWSAESPGAAGAPLGLGLDAPIERQGSLTIDSARTTVTTQDLAHGTTTTQVLDTDPGLLNRKFAIRWKTTSFGVQLPLALPRFSLGQGLSITPTLVLQAAGSDFGLDFVDLPEPQASTSLHGRGLQLGAALDLVGPLCRRCGWYAGAGYRYRFLPSFTVERGQPVEEPGARVTASEVRLGRTVGEASLRIGRVFDRDRVALYVGVLRRQTRTTVDDRLTLLEDAIAQQTRLVSRTGFASTATAALAGLDVHVRGPLFVRAEVTFGKDDSTVLGKLVLVPPLWPWFPEVHLCHSADPAQQRACQIAAEIAPGLAAIRKRFVKESRRLLARQPAPSALEVSRLLDDTEGDLLSLLHYPELAALRDYVQDLFAEARAGLGLAAPRAAAAGLRTPLAPPVRARVLAALLPPGWASKDVRMVRQRTTIDPTAEHTWFGKILEKLGLLTYQFEHRIERINLCIKSKQEQLHFWMHPKSTKEGRDATTVNVLQNVYRGKYVYTVKADPHLHLKTFDDENVILNLVDESPTVLDCELKPEGSIDMPTPCLRSYEAAERCP